ncbi:DUF5043 domain-containing protein [Bacteroides sp. AN502(2024)]|uniref:DUF5043 domain-containing protein n=1 Tax=Bacteroides sp. AN502(2024) TaxID=3160599 RepID=UPI003515101C
MKHLLLFFFVLLNISATAQINYYEVTKTFNENGYIYQCKVDRAKMVTLYNKENEFVHVDQTNQTTGEQMHIDYKTNQLEDDHWTNAKLLSIVDKAIPDEERLLIKKNGGLLTILLNINSNTGKVADVVYNFVNFRAYATIPVSVYRQIEIEIKEKIWFVPNQEGKKWNYICLFYTINPQ